MVHTSSSTKKRKQPKPPLEAEVTLLDWAPRGSTISEVEDRRILVDRGIPGERVMAMIDRRRKPWLGVVDGVIKPSPDRIAPLCPHYLAGCGGCQWQHVGYEAQLRNKENLVNREMEIHKLSRRVDKVWAMDVPWRYRRTAAIAIGWEAGFRPHGRRGIVEIRDCPISHPLIGELADSLNNALRRGAIPNYHGKVWLDCTVVGPDLHPGLQLVIQGIEGLTTERFPELPDVASFLADLPSVVSVSYRHRSGAIESLVGDPMGTIYVAGRPMYLPAGSFSQTNSHMLTVLLNRMRSAIQGRDIANAADIYGGIGTLGLQLADCVDRMALIELDGGAVEAARRTASEWGLTAIDFISRHAEKVVPEMLSLDLAIVDPPRCGLGDIVVDALAATAVPFILYVSCAPPSLARDLAQFARHDYSIETLDIFDFYPQTYHVESLAVLRK